MDDLQKTIVTSGFPPILGASARVLILGSLPSQKSLQKLEYYGNPQNVFWRIMGEIIGAGPELQYQERVKILIRNGIAVWDVLAASVRSGSMDSAIDEATARANDFDSILVGQSDFQLVCFNGQSAARFFDRLVPQKVRQSMQDLEFVTLPSTSPAHAAMSFPTKLKRWSVIVSAMPVDRSVTL
jgi:double-stranded uracil-DNA glycosylase